MTGKDNLTDEDKAVLAQMLAKREESRKKQAAAAASGAPATPAPAGDLAKRWASESFLGDEQEEGLNAPLPKTTPVGIVAVRGSSGVVLYRDGRCRFSIAIPGKPSFVPASGGLDATCTLADAPITVSLIMVPAQPGDLAAQAAALAGDLTQAAPSPLALGQPGVLAAAAAELRQGNEVRSAAVLAGADAKGAHALVIVMLDHDRATVDAATVATVRAAILGSAAFTPEPRHRIPALLPDSPWLEPGLPLRSPAGRPALPGGAALAERLLAIAGDLPPDRPLEGEPRAAALAALAGAGEGVELATVHDLRGVALAALRG